MLFTRIFFLPNSNAEDTVRLSKPAFLFAKKEGLEAHALASQARGEGLESNVFVSNLGDCLDD